MGETYGTARAVGASGCELAHDKAHAIAGFSLPRSMVCGDEWWLVQPPNFRSTTAWTLAWVYKQHARTSP